MKYNEMFGSSWRSNDDNDNDMLDSTAQMLNEHDKIDGVNQNVVSQLVQEVDHSVFDNQNVQYTYHQLPNVLGQVFQLSGSQPHGISNKKSEKSLCNTNDGRMDELTSPLQLDTHRDQKQHNPYTSNLSQINPAGSCMKKNNGPGSKHSQVENSIDSTPKISETSSSMDHELTSTHMNSTKSNNSTLGRSTNFPYGKKTCNCDTEDKEFKHHGQSFLRVHRKKRKTSDILSRKAKLHCALTHFNLKSTKME